MPPCLHPIGSKLFRPPCSSRIGDRRRPSRMVYHIIFFTTKCQTTPSYVFLAAFAIPTLVPRLTTNYPLAPRHVSSSVTLLHRRATGVLTSPPARSSSRGMSFFMRLTFRLQLPRPNRICLFFCYRTYFPLQLLPPRMLSEHGLSKMTLVILLASIRPFYGRVLLIGCLRFLGQMLLGRSLLPHQQPLSLLLLGRSLLPHQQLVSPGAAMVFSIADSPEWPRRYPRLQPHRQWCCRPDRHPATACGLLRIHRFAL